MNIQEIENHVEEYYIKNNPSENVYHNIEHVKEVVEMVKNISADNNIPKAEAELVVAAAWLHDIGHIKTWDNHEEVSANYAKNYLSVCELSNEEIDTILGCIRATKIPHKPNNLLEEIICDADVSQIGSEDFFIKSNLLRDELAKRKNEFYTDKDWVKRNIDFINKTEIYTNFGKSNWENQRQINLEKLNEQYKLLENSN